jgi:predicted DNA-binding transcriptional regulator AlpA
MAAIETIKYVDNTELVARDKPYVHAGASRTTIWRMVCNGEMVAPVHSVRHKHFWLASDIDAWVETFQRRRLKRETLAHAK